MQVQTDPIYCLTQVLHAVEARTAETKAKLAQLVEEAKPMQWGSPEKRLNDLMQEYVRGELLGLAYATGSLEGRIGVTKIWLS